MTEIPLKGVSIDVKRLYLPVLLKSNCPDCTEELYYDMSIDNLSYPVMGETEYIHFYCDECGCEYTRDLVLKMTLEYEDEGEIIE